MVPVRDGAQAGGKLQESVDPVGRFVLVGRASSGPDTVFALLRAIP